MRLENRLLIYILLPLVLLIIILSFILRLYSTDLFNKYASDMLYSDAEILKERIEKEIKRASSDLILLLANEAVVNYFMYSEQGLLDHAEDMRWLIEKGFLRAGMEKPEYFAIRLINIDGRSVIDIIGGRIGYIHYDFSDMEWFKETLLLTKGDGNISEPYLCREFGKPTITVSRLYIDDVGRKMGVVSVDIHVAELFDRVVSKHVKDGYAYLINKDGLIMAHTDRAMVGSVLQIDKDDAETKKVSVPLEIRDANLVVARSMKELHSFGRELHLFNLLFSVVMVSVVILVVTITIRRFSKPLRQIASTMDELRKGRLDVKMEIDVSGENELSVLSKAFNSMTLALKERELLLRESEERYRTLFETANDAIYIIEPETYRIVDCNKKAEELFGYRLEDLREIGFKGLHDPDEIGIVLNKINEVRDSGLPTTIPEHYHIKRDGGKVVVEVNISIIEVGGRRLMICIARDVTERKKRDEEIKKRVKELEEFYEIAVHRELKIKELRERLEKKEEELKRLREQYKGDG